jgi:hypothetical protein
MKSSRQNKIFTWLTHFPNEILNNFYESPFFQSVFNTQYRNDAVSFYRSISKATSTPEFHTAVWSNLLARESELESHTSCNAEGTVSQSPLLGLCHVFVITVATLVTLLLAMLLLALFSSVNVWKVIFLMSCQHGSTALKAGSVHGPAVTHFCQL